MGDDHDGNKIKLSCDATMENGSKRCTFQTSKLKRSKAKQRLRSHIHAKHSKGLEDQNNIAHLGLEGSQAAATEIPRMLILQWHL